MFAELCMVRGLFASTITASSAAYVAMDGINEAAVAI